MIKEFKNNLEKPLTPEEKEKLKSELTKFAAQSKPELKRIMEMGSEAYIKEQHRILKEVQNSKEYQELYTRFLSEMDQLNEFKELQRNIEESGIPFSLDYQQEDWLFNVWLKKEGLEKQIDEIKELVAQRVRKEEK